MTSHFFIDLHCHPSIKAFARSFRNEPGIQSDNPDDDTSIWRRDAPSLFDKVKQYAAGLTNFIQSDARSLLAGRVSVVCLSFYPQEKGFFINKLGQDFLSDTVTKLASEFGQERIDYIQAHDSYWEDLKNEMNFLRQQSGKKIVVDGPTVSYEIANSYADIEQAELEGALGETKILFIPSIEGAHVFDQAMNFRESWNTFSDGIAPENLQRTLDRVAELRDGKNGLLRPFFMTFAHHFWNGLCGHERSLGGIVKCIADQSNGLGTGFTKAGRLVAKAMLERRHDESGESIPRILIDIKHMSRKSREEYFVLLETEFPDENIPLIASHACVTGLSKPGGAKLTQAAQEGLYMEDAINIYDDELVKIEASAGLIGIQLDERRIGSKTAIRSARGNISRRAILYSWSKLVWNQARHIAEVLDMNGSYAWGIQSLGTDFDGIIDPINGYWTSKQMDDLDDYLLKHAYNYLTAFGNSCPLVQERNRSIKAEEVVERIMTGNALNFLAANF